jgi:hypothetical protein
MSTRSAASHHKRRVAAFEKMLADAERQSIHDADESLQGAREEVEQLRAAHKLAASVPKALLRPGVFSGAKAAACLMPNYDWSFMTSS